MQESLLQHIQKVWPEYEIGEKIGAGSYAEVFRAVRKDIVGAPGIEDYAAIKIIEIPKNQSEIDNLLSAYGYDIDVRAYYEAVANKYMQEVRTMQVLNGKSNVVDIKDYRCLRKQHSLGWGICILMELLTPLTKYIRNESLDESEVLKLGIDICTALEECERRRIIHRDIKPDNLFVDFYGNFKLGDFGVARTLNDLTNGMSQKGTPNYWAPEIAVGSDYNSTADLYSLGIVLYQMMNNKRLPFISTSQSIGPSQSQEALDRRLRGEPMPPPVNASPALRSVILKACAFDPKMRYQNATEMKRALLQIRDKAMQPAFFAAPQAAAYDGEKTVAVTGGSSGRPGSSVPAGNVPPQQQNRQNSQQAQQNPGNQAMPFIPPAPRPKEQPPAPPAQMENAPRTEDDGEEPQRGKKNGLKIFLIVLAALLALGLLVLAGVLIIRNLQDDDSSGGKNSRTGKDDETVNVPTHDPQASPGYPTISPEPSQTIEVTDEPTVTPTPAPEVDPMSYYAYGMDIGHNFAIALKPDGTVVATGKNETVINAVTNWRNIVQVAAGWDFALGLTEDGHVLFAGPDSANNKRIDRNVIANWRNVEFISANACACAALDSYGNILVTGGPQDKKDTTYYSVPSSIYSNGRPTSISVGVFHILVLFENRTVRAIYNDDPKLTETPWLNVNNWSNIIQIAAGERGSVGLTFDGEVVYSGLTNHNQGEFYGETNVVSIASKGWHLCMVKKDGTVKTVGYKDWGQCASLNVSGKTAVAIATSGWTTAAIFDDGTVKIVGSDDNIDPNKVANWRNIVKSR